MAKVNLRPHSQTQLSKILRPMDRGDAALVIAAINILTRPINSEASSKARASVVANAFFGAAFARKPARPASKRC
jgi:hypothetical protein